MLPVEEDVVKGFISNEGTLLGFQSLMSLNPVLKKRKQRIHQVQKQGQHPELPFHVAAGSSSLSLKSISPLCGLHVAMSYVGKSREVFTLQ